ncbi:MAG: hypothetical protein J0I09_01410 [Sphingobacteriia bacterium]|nr:hypothetical protein [Sphingobacteriia bacterium]
MAQQKIELRKIRDFGENISDSLQFIRQEFKPLLTCFIAFAGIFLLAYGIYNGLYQSHFWRAFLHQTSADTSESFQRFNRDSFAKNLLLNYIVLFFFVTLNYTAMSMSIASYFKVYDIKQNGPPTLEEVWQYFKKYFLKAYLYALILSLLVILGCLFCLLPGIYFWVILAPFNMVLVMEDFSFSAAFNKCFRMIKDNFWQSLGIYFIAYLIYAFSGGIIGLIIGAITGVGSYLTTKNVSQTAGLVSGILGVTSHLFYLVFFTCIGFNYFSLTEKTDAEGLMRKIENMGNDTETTTEEQY